MKGLVLPLDVVQRLLAYLDTQPHGHVRNFVDAITTAPQVTVQEPPAATPPTPDVVATPADAAPPNRATRRRLAKVGNGAVANDPPTVAS